MSSEDDLEVVECARYGEFDELKELLDTKKANIDTADRNGTTALHMGEYRGVGECIWYIVSLRSLLTLRCLKTV